MAAERTVEVFTGGCPLCEKTVTLVRRIACPSCSVAVRNMQDPETIERARTIGVRAIPAVAIDGKLLACCEGGGVDEVELKAAGVGDPL
ncbi:MAG: thioredoxin family protein [Nitrospirota bacterium]|nr:thioredoxin family protein [Nitrospirota bacterium]